MERAELYVEENVELISDDMRQGGYDWIWWEHRPMQVIKTGVNFLVSILTYIF